MSTAATHSSEQVIALAKKVLIGNYTRYPVCLVRGEGSWVWDAEGNRYLDFFHGRTMGSLSATAQPKYHAGVEPILPGFLYAPYGDLDAAAKLIDAETCAVMLEPIQGEGGVNLPPAGYLEGLRRLCDEHGMLL